MNLFASYTVNIKDVLKKNVALSLLEIISIYYGNILLVLDEFYEKNNIPLEGKLLKLKQLSNKYVEDYQKFQKEQKEDIVSSVKITKLDSYLDLLDFFYKFKKKRMTLIYNYLPAQYPTFILLSFPFFVLQNIFSVGGNDPSSLGLWIFL